VRLKHVARLLGGGTPSKENEEFWTGGNVPWASPKDMKRRVIVETEDYITEAAVSSSATSYIEPGSPLMVVRSGILRHTLPVAIAGCRLTINQDMKAFRLGNRVLHRFLVYWIDGQSHALLLEWRQFGATVESVDTNRMMNGRIALPDLPTQTAIADFLDRETARIDQLIEKKERLRLVLEEKLAREVDAVLIGSRIDGPTKAVDSCELLTSIPASWQMRRLKAVCSHLGNGFVGPTRDILIENDDPGAVPYIQSTHIKNRSIEFDRRPYFVHRDWLASKPKARIRTNDLLIVQTGDCGATSIVGPELDGAGCHALIIARPTQREIDPRLLLHLLSSSYGRSKLERIQTGALHPHLEVGFVKDVALPVPPRDQQPRVVELIDAVVQRVSHCSRRTGHSIALLRELRSALITAAVTGQIDVATWGKRGETDRRLETIEHELEAEREEAAS
jgi:type I restriction enzyme S subunit